MTAGDSETGRRLKKAFGELGLHRPMRFGRYQDGDLLEYEIESVETGQRSICALLVEKFVGGGFAGQVYKVRVSSGGDGVLAKDGVYALKILVPPSSFSRLFRDLLYKTGFQASFQPQVSPAAAKAGALWQKFIRRGAKVTFGTDSGINDVHALFVDRGIGSCGEISDWIDGRTWRLETDDRMDLLSLHLKGRRVKEESLGSPEFRGKREFMARLVSMLHEMGAHEFARQYEWSTCKSQPNALKLKSSDDSPAEGLIAVDFRAGLTLLPFLPMSPGDFRLIFDGLMRGSIVQFDRGDLDRLKGFVDRHHREFAEMLPMLAELERVEGIYRNSMPDVTHNRTRLLRDGKLLSGILDASREAWKTEGLIDEGHDEDLRGKNSRIFSLKLLSAVPFIGRPLLKFVGHGEWKKHYTSLLTSPAYFAKALRARRIESSLRWLQQGRITGETAEKISGSLPMFLLFLPLALLPISMYRVVTSWAHLKERLYRYLVRPLMLYFSPKLREDWLRNMVKEGRDNYILSDSDAEVILSQIGEPYIQKYLKSLAVHVLLMPTTHIVSLIVSWFYIRTHPGISTAEAMAAVAAILVLFQITPISPGSIARGLYVVYLVARERNVRDYNIALPLAFFKYIGYLAFPIQMTYKYPEMARFMAAFWATEAVHAVPVFGERGALLEHWIYRLFYNWPLTIRRRIAARSALLAGSAPRYWHIAVYAAGASVLFTAVALSPLQKDAVVRAIWAAGSFLCGAGVTLGCGGAALSKRILSAALWGFATSVLCTALFIAASHGPGATANDIVAAGAWRFFLFTVFSTVGAIATDLWLPSPDIETHLVK